MHGLWKKSEVFDSFRRYFGGNEFRAPDIDWGAKEEEYLNILDIYAEKFQPDVIIGYSFGGYAVQRLFERNPNAARLCVLVAPVGPKGISWRGVWGCITSPAPKEEEKYFPEKISTLMRVFPGRGKVEKPILVPTLIVSGGEDRFVSMEDAEKITTFHKATHYHYYDLDHGELASDMGAIYGIKIWLSENIKK